MLRTTLVEVHEIAKSPARTQATSASKKHLDPRLQHGYELLFKRCMTLEPRLIARRGVWQRNVLWSVFPPGLGRFGQRRLAAAGQKRRPCLRPSRRAGARRSDRPTECRSCARAHRALANDEDASCLTGTQHRARTERQMRFALLTAAHRCQQRLERAMVFLGHNSFLTHGEYSTIRDAELDAENRYVLNGLVKEA